MKNLIKKILRESSNENKDDGLEWMRDVEPKSLGFNDDNFHDMYYLAKKAEYISNIISGNVYIKIKNPKKYSDLLQVFYDLGYRKFDGTQTRPKDHGLNNFWRTNNYLVIYNNGVTNKVVDYQRNGELRPIRKGSDFSLELT